MRLLAQTCVAIWCTWGALMTMIYAVEINRTYMINEEYRQAVAAAPEMVRKPDSIMDGVAIYEPEPLDLGMVDIPNKWVRQAARQAAQSVDTTYPEYVRVEIGETTIPKSKPEEPEIYVPVPNPKRVTRLARAQDRRTKTAWASLAKKGRRPNKTKSKKRKSRRKSRSARSSNLGGRVTKTKVRQPRPEPKTYTPELRKALRLASR